VFLLNISIAIPNSSLSDDLTKLDKSRKISDIARACAIFKVRTIYIYKDGNEKNDQELLVTILKYLDTPPFLRKALFPRINTLKYAGVLHPLKIPSHLMSSDPKKIKTNDIRDGVVISNKGKKFVNFAINQLIPYYGKANVGKRITAQFKKGYPELIIKEITREEISQYWGFTVKERSDLFSLILSWPGNTILTSRKGKIISQSLIKKYIDSKKPILVVYGSTNKDIHEILGSRIKKIQNSKTLNFFLDQGTETVRLEEAILGTLSILNLYHVDHH